ncbi:MAG: hypothetical protein ACYC5M_07885 [Anaerolineae bacterium]
MASAVRVRISLTPDPTAGVSLHDAQRALLAYLAAQHTDDLVTLVVGGGSLTSTQRDDLAWLGLTWQEDPAGDSEPADSGAGPSEETVARLRSEGYLPEVVVAALVDSAAQALPNAMPTGPAGAGAERLPALGEPAILRATNCRALRSAPVERVASLMQPRLVSLYGAYECSVGTAHLPDVWYHRLVEATRAEASTLGEIDALCAFALAAERPPLTPAARDVLAGPWVPEVLQRCLDTLSVEHLETPDQAAQFLRSLRHHLRDTRGLRGQQVMHPVRAALTGTLVGPCLGIVASLLGLERVRRRLAATAACLGVEDA